MNEPELPGISLTFLYYFSTTALVVLLALAQGLGLGFEKAIAYQTSSAIALLVGIVGTVRNRGITRQFSVKNRSDCEPILTQALNEMGFAEQEPWQDHIAYYPIRGWGKGKIFVKWEKRSLTLIGRAHLLRRLQSRLADVGIKPLATN
jgi:hypothetical protein